jgi:hypothetical protein
MSAGSTCSSGSGVVSMRMSVTVSTDTVVVVVVTVSTRAASPPLVIIGGCGASLPPVETESVLTDEPA